MGEEGSVNYSKEYTFLQTIEEESGKDAKRGLILKEVYSTGNIPEKHN